MLIKVSQDHIDRGRRFQIESCPIALALTEAGFKGVWTCLGYAVVDGREIPLPKEAGEFILLFDSNCPTQPFSFKFNARLPFFQRLKTAISECISNLGCFD